MRALIVPGVAALALVASACGGGDDRLSRDEFVERANAVCEKYDERLNEIDQPSSPEDVPEYVDRAVPILEDGVAELRSLEPPEELEEDYDRMVDEVESVIPTARELRDAVEEGDERRIRELIEEGNRADERSDAIARDLGLDRCAEDEQS